MSDKKKKKKWRRCRYIDNMRVADLEELQTGALPFANQEILVPFIGYNQGSWW